jgi:uncharacterized lipoprotein YbaY
MVIQGELTFTEGSSNLSGARLTVQLLEVSRADARARVVAEQEQTLNRESNTSRPLAFALSVDALGAREQYVLSAHLDMDGDGKVGVGDYITMEAFPVAQANARAHHVIRLRRVG